jgi:predicted lipoprotein with Yx(FWY)xxD motif
MKTFLSLLAALAVWACASVAVSAAPATDKSGVLTDNNGKTLYIFKKDSAGQSNCNGPCAKAWPPFAVADASKANAQFKVITRQDGSQQWAFNGQPLYYYVGDSAPGEMAGEGSGGVWYVVRAAAKPAAAPTRSSSGY